MIESLSLILISEIIITKEFSLHTLCASLLLLIGHTFWYVRAYIILLLISPFLDILIKHCKIGCIVCASVFILDFIPVFCGRTKLWKDVVQFAMIYILTGLLLNFGIDKLRASFWRYLLTAGILFVLLYYWFSFDHQYTKRYSALMLICAFSAFMLARLAKPFYSRFVSTASKGTLAVYILHVAFQDRLADLFRVSYFYGTPWWFPAIIAITLIIFGSITFIYVAAGKILSYISGIMIDHSS